MFRFIVALLCLGAICYADPITVSVPIPVSGSGSWSSSINGLDMRGFFSGTNGVDTAGLSFAIFFDVGSGSFVPSSVQCFYPSCTAEGGIDTAVLLSGFGVYGSVGGGTGYLNVTAGPQLASAPLIGWFNVTSETLQYVGTPNQTISGTFAIVPTPEPSTWATIALAGLSSILSASRRTARR